VKIATPVAAALALVLAPALAVRASAGKRPLDLVIAVDTSGSMDDEVNEVEAGLNDFATHLRGQGHDLHIILLAEAGALCVPAPLGSGACPADENLPGYRHVLAAVGSTDALERILSLQSEYTSSLRPGSRRVLLVVSDDESDMSASAFTAQLTALDPDFASFQFSAIAASVNPVCLPVPNACCRPPFELLAAAEGAVYKQLVDQTSGAFYDLCLQDFAPAWPALAAAVAIFLDGFEE
jgi:hypothetical protein